ncbi:MAG: sugar ABC transporter permease [Oscillospiraceae bacterium]|nr:sugar ABC transporter permease [Oscillospiraceae bacterium]
MEAAEGLSRKKVLGFSVVFMGLAHIALLKQYIKGALFALVEIVFLVFSPSIVRKLIDMMTLGDEKPDLPVTMRDNSVFMLIDGVMILAVVLIFAALYYISVRSALQEHERAQISGSFSKNTAVISNLSGNAFPIAALSPTLILVVFFVVVPLVFSALVAFTNYSTPDHIPPNKTVDWVGLENFIYLFGGDATWTGALLRVAVWTLCWALLATFTCYFGGMIMAVVLQESKLKIVPAFRSIFILPYAVPAVVTMLVWKNLLNGAFGTVNRTLIELGVINNAIPWLSDEWLAKFTTILINLWAGFPYFMLLVTGTMTAISADIYEAATIDGANKFQTFRHVTLPLVIYQTAPLIIMSFTHNINNFGAIFFLTGGNPVVADSTMTSAKGTDILVTWIYNLTVNLLKYNYASVLAVMIFVFLAPVAIFNFRRTKSYKEGEL